jgi:hypothetical protein
VNEIPPRKIFAIDQTPRPAKFEARSQVVRRAHRGIRG